MAHRNQGYFAHSPNESGKADPVCSHLEAVAGRAAEYAALFGAADEARMAGLLHDLGKYGHLFQKRLAGKERRIDHWSAGAWVALTKYKHEGIIATALAIQGHHIGLQHASADVLKSLEPQKLREKYAGELRLSDPDPDHLLQLLAADGVELARDFPGSAYEGLGLENTAAKMLDVRMLFSALVDADFIETEAHFQASGAESKCYRQPGPLLEPARALSVLTSYIEDLASQSKASVEVNQLRSDLLQACLNEATSPPGLLTLTAPTGAGKTLSMLALALKHAVEHNLRRIVMVIPYLSIIEQTVRAYREALAEFGDVELLTRYVLEDHSLAGTRGKVKRGELDAEDELQRQIRILAENWDAPIVVTTSVQFLESLFANRSSACRKLHRLAQSVILFDEVQTLPSSLAVPTLATLSRLAERYGASIVFATATQPAFAHLDDPVRKYCAGGWQPREIVPKSAKLFERVKRTRVAWPSDICRSTPWANLAEQIAGCDQVLCIVNLKRHAQRLLDELRLCSNTNDLLHLSTSMCPAHRQAVLEEVRGRLAEGQLCRLISTQCVEAGVDVDFPVVFRAWGPLDAIAQAAGRCNRNGRAKMGTVYVFLPETEAKGKIYPDGAYQQAAQVASMFLNERGTEQMDIHNTELFAAYYRELYDIAKPETKNKELLAAILGQNFVETAELYRVIKQDVINVLVPYDLEAFQRLAEEVRETGLTSRWIAQARPHTVGLFRPQDGDPVWSYLDPVPVGRRRESSEEWFIYLEKEHYHSLTGLVPPSSMECLIG